MRLAALGLRGVCSEVLGETVFSAPALATHSILVTLDSASRNGDHRQERSPCRK
jgi:hypothetical protein